MEIKKFDGINVVPFIDIMLVLLVIVLTTATFIAKGVIPVELPEAQAQSAKIEKKDLIITVKAGGAIFFDKQPVEKRQVLKRLQRYDRKQNVRINCDKSVAFAQFVHILDALKTLEFQNVGIVTEDG